MSRWIRNSLLGFPGPLRGDSFTIASSSGAAAQGGQAFGETSVASKAEGEVYWRINSCVVPSGSAFGQNMIDGGSKTVRTE